MPLFQEIDLSTYTGGQIVAIAPGSVAAKAGLQAGDELLAINGSPV
ncbi:MAG: PDZ domain-containing protein, partial [Anaerolineales bacterium]|nr:PDZ domain-containing protein [Anaerolineales bacterium]